MRLNTEPDFDGLKALLAEPELFDASSMEPGLPYLRSSSKRILDLALCVGTFPLYAPPAVLGIAGVALVDHSKPIFRQARIGRLGVPFHIAKIRTMPHTKDDTHSNGRHDDERRSALGKMLSLSRVDELLNIFNILKGEMSVVGPRPLLGSYMALVRHVVGPKEADGWVKDRCQALTGLSDEFTIRHHGGKIKDDEAERIRVRIPLERKYIFETASLKEDLRIIRDTGTLLGRTAAKHSHVRTLAERFENSAS
jgi:lipopolysaccharide/colanic/teichoic acid biosynthesis glycosyltransferase